MRFINNRVVGGNYFFIQKRTGGNELQYYLDQFDENDYWIYKSTRKQKLVGGEWKEFKYGSYIFFKKEIYNKDDIDKWIEFIGEFGGFMFMIKPFPPIEIMKKIKVIKCGH